MIKDKRWYIVQTFSGFENIVIRSLHNHIKLYKMEHLFDDIMVPAEEIIEVKHGKKIKSERKFFPGYILINMMMNNSSWHLVRSIPRIIGFIGGKSEKPTPVSNKEINNILEKIRYIGNKPKPKILFEPGELIRVKEGPFSDFNGTVENVDYEKNRLKVSVTIFGRSTPVELNFNQVEKN